MADQLAFTARAVFMWKSNRLYRVHLSGNEFFFIRIGGQGGWREAALGGMHSHPLSRLLLRRHAMGTGDFIARAG